VKDIKTNAYAIKVATLWKANTNIQFFFDSYAATSYYTSYLTKFDKTVTNEFQTIIKKCENENVDANLKVRKLGNVFLNAQ
jgi:competence CoiA-like predicted nuclease